MKQIKVPFLKITTYIKQRGQSGATLVEYVLLVSLILLISISAIRILGGKVSNNFSNVSAQFPGDDPAPITGGPGPPPPPLCELC